MDRAPVWKEVIQGLVTCRGVSEVLKLLDLESLHGHGLALVPGPVDDGAAPALAQDAALVLTVLQLAVFQEEPAENTAHVGWEQTPWGAGPGLGGRRGCSVTCSPCGESGIEAVCGVRQVWAGRAALPSRGLTRGWPRGWRW